ncbi:TetR/AcrR family transcriptional regulator [Kordiimonas aestuarii]|uniref:TetR/AcrR family transcriptional regulator n=1 Tax=Kordiimonas aestuarii TaxID=1005925 RepID=UPI0021D219B2|nr:TetR/AcrR family transcriptional regulator [Kordiimonas aestuarii]
MGYSRAQKKDNHKKIVAIAAKRFREQGLDGLSVAAIMKEAGLTHGGFYSHFKSRDDMVAQALAHAFTEDEERLLRAMKRRGGPSLEAFLSIYLSPAHRDTPGQGCTLAAVACEAARKDADIKALFTDRVAGYSERLAPELGVTPDQMVAVLSAAAGALVLSRSVSSEAMSDNILGATRRELLATIRP